MLQDATRADLVFKKIVNRQYTTTAKQWYEENPGVPFKLKGSDVWIDNIPETPPVADSAVVKGFRVANKLVLTKDESVNDNKGWFAEVDGSKAGGFISPRYGQGYTARLFIQGGAEIPTTHASGWFFDYESGNLTFEGNPPGSAFEVVCYQYIGSTADDLAEALEGSAWQDPVLNIVDAPPGGEVGGERYLISATPSGDFAGHPEELAEFDGVSWKFSTPSAGKITYVIALDRLYVYDNNDGWAWSGIDSADLDYDNADSDLNSLSVKDALDELDALAKEVTTVLWVDSNRTDSYVETGSVVKPFKTLAAAQAVVEAGDTVNLAPGTYDGAGMTMPDGVSVIGDGYAAVQNAITFGTDTTSQIVLENVNFINKGDVVINNTVDVKNLKFDGSLTFNSDLVVGYNVDINTDVAKSALTVTGKKTVIDLITVTQSADQLSLDHSAGTVVFSTSKFVGTRAGAVANSSGGNIETSFTSFTNNGAGLALNIDNSALADAPNKLYDTIHSGGIETNDAVTIVEGVNGGNPTSTVTDDANLIYRGGTQLKNDSTIIKSESGGILIGNTLNDSIDRVAQVAQYDQTHGFLVIDPCIDDIDIT